MNALINPVGPDFTDSKYQIYLMNSQNEANFVISKIEQNKTAKPLTRATEAKVNRGVYDLTVTLKDGLNLRMPFLQMKHTHSVQKTHGTMK